jgi:DNA-binding response OmpR family regulator/TolB-like protein
MPSTSPRSVLIVEDERLLAHSLQRGLADLGYDAFAVAASAEEAMARAAERRPDVALINVRIRGRLDGIKAAQLLQERFAVPVVYLAGQVDDATVQRALKTGPYGYLVKPVEPAELRRAIEIALSRHAEGRGQAAWAAPAGTAPPRDGRAPGARAVRRQLERLFASPDFDAPRRSREFLNFVVEEALAGRGQEITQGTIAVEVFGRRDDFDATVDPIVRIQAGRLRRSLERYYLLAGKEDPVRMELPKGSYVPIFRTVAAEGGSARPAEAVAPAAPATQGKTDDGWPSVVVRDFEATGGANEVGELALDLSEELALELGRYRTVRVLRQKDLAGSGPLAPRGARFVVDGRIRRDGEDLRVTVGLLDRTSGEQIWGDEYHTATGPQRWSESAEDMARVMAARVGAEEGVLVQLLATERRKRPPVERTPYDAILLSAEFFLARGVENFRPALEGLRKVVESEPESGLAWTRLARLCLANYAFEVTAIPTPIDEAITYAHRGVRLDPASRSARCILASCLLVKGELAAGREELEQALRSSPGSLVYLEIIGYLLTLLGDWERGQALSRSALDRNPHCLPFVLFGMWADHVRRGNIEQACQVALEFRDPTFFWRSVMRASCLGLLGRDAEAEAELAELLSQKPDFPARGHVLLGHYLKFPEVMGPVVDGLARAGLDAARGWRLAGGR